MKCVVFILVLLTSFVFSKDEELNIVYLYTLGEDRFEINSLYQISNHETQASLLKAIINSQLSESRFTWTRRGYLIILRETNSQFWTAYEWRPWMRVPTQLIPTAVVEDDGFLIRKHSMFSPNLKVQELSLNLTEHLQYELENAIQHYKAKK